MWVGGEARGREGKKKCIERRGSRSAEEIMLAWWPEAFQLSGCHYLSFLSVRGSVLVLRCRGRIHIHAQPDTTVALTLALSAHSNGWCVVNHKHEFIYLVICLLVSHCFLYCSKSVLYISGQQQLLSKITFIASRQTVWYMMVKMNVHSTLTNYEMWIHCHLNTEAKRQTHSHRVGHAVHFISM